MRILRRSEKNVLAAEFKGLMQLFRILIRSPQFEKKLSTSQLHHCIKQFYGKQQLSLVFKSYRYLTNFLQVETELCYFIFLQTIQF